MTAVEKKYQQINKNTLALLRSYRKSLQESGLEIEGVILFGSHAKGTQHEWSDIDIAVISSEFGKDRLAERVQLTRLGDKISLAIEPHPFHPVDLADRWNSLAAEVKKYGIPIE